ncbi:hypothetical protein [Kouleothrix sp.]|uniref:hypothetical protein n=1 Tax=Kouleothrix sp. TaxID=2779161 RepID=UPI00391B2658
MWCRFAAGLWGIALNRRVKTDRAIARLALWLVPLLLLTAISVSALNATRNAVLGPEGSPARVELEIAPSTPRSWARPTWRRKTCRRAWCRRITSSAKARRFELA